MVSRIAASCLAMLLVAPVARAQVAAPAKPADAVRAEFDAASAEMKRIVGEAAILQAKWHQPNADKAAIEGKFTALESEGRAAGRRLEAAALGMVKVDPKNADARKICNAAAAAALQGDDPQRALAGAQAAADAGAAEPDVMLVAATAATILSQLDEAEAWIKKAVAAGVPAERTAELERGIAASREKVAAEMKQRETDAAADLPRVKIETTAGDVVVELFEDDAPNTVANFVSLVEKGFYDGTPFHRVIPGFMAQGGDPTGSGRGGPGYAIACECALPTARKHFLGSLSMAHAGPNTGGSQFFLTFVPTEHLDGKHTVFGRVIEGFDVLPLITRTQDSQGRTIAGIEPATITKASMVRKRNHPYEPKTLPDPRK